MEQKAFARSIVPYHMPGNMLICSSNKTTFERATAIDITIWLSLWKPTVILQNPSVFHRGQTSQMGCGRNHHPCIFQVFNGGTNFYNLSRNTILVLVYYLGSSSGSHLALLKIIAFTPQVRKWKWEFYQFLGMSIIIMHYGIWEIMHSGIWVSLEAHWFSVRQTQAKALLITDLYQSLL